MASLFTKIIKGEIPSHKILEDQNYFSFLDIRPIKPGHTLVVPKVEKDYIFDQDDAVLSGLLLFAKKVASALKKTIPCKRIGIIVAGLEVPHTHVHLIPMNSVSDLDFSKAIPTDHHELGEVAKQIKASL